MLIAVKAASLNYRDLMIAKRFYPLPLLENVIPLSDRAGEIIAVGEGVTRWKAGDRVCGSFFQSWTDGPIPQDAQMHTLGGPMHGMLAQQVVLSQEGVVRMPEHLSYERADREG